MGCIHSRFSRLFDHRTAARQPAVAARDASDVHGPPVNGGHARRTATTEMAKGVHSEDVRMPKAPPRTPPRAPYSPPQATPSKVYQQPGGYKFGDSQKALVEEDGEPSLEDKLSDPFSAPVVAKKGAARSPAVEKTQASTTASVTATVSNSAITSKKSQPISDEEKSLLDGTKTGAGWSSDEEDGTASLESSSCETSAQMSQLEMDAFKAVQELGLFVKSISVSEVLARTPQLVFLNLVTLEGNAYCVELTQRGWRICSDRADAANCDASLELLAKYFETIYALLGDVSPAYRDRFGAALSEKSSKLPRDNRHDSSGSDAEPQNGGGPPQSNSEDASD